MNFSLKFAIQIIPLVVEQFAVGFWMNTLFQLCKTQLFEDFGENVDDEDK